MSALEDAQYAADRFQSYAGADTEAIAKSQIITARAHIALAEQQHIANLIALLPHVDRASRSNVLDDLGELLGIELVQNA